MGGTYARFLKVLTVVLVAVAFVAVPEVGLAKKKKKKKKRKKDVAAEVAKPEDPQQIEARERYSKGKGLYEAKQYAEALVEFQAAYDLKPHPTVLKSIAECQIQTGDLMGAIKNFEVYLADPAAPKRAEIEGRLAKVKAMMATVEVTSVPEGAGVMVDGAVTDKITPAKLELIPGDHEIAFNLDGYDPVVKQVTLAEGAKSQVQVDFAEEGSASPAGGALADPFAEEGQGGDEGKGEDIQVDNESEGPPTAFWVAAAVAGVGVVSGTVFGTMALGDEKDFEDATDPSERDDIKTSGNRNAIIADVSFGVAAAAAIVGVIVLVTNKDGEAEASVDTSKADVKVLPVATGDSLGLSTAVTF